MNPTFGLSEGRVDVVARLCMVVDWCIDHLDYLTYRSNTIRSL